MRALLAGLMIVLAIGFTGCSGSDDGGDAAPAAEDSGEGSGN